MSPSKKILRFVQWAAGLSIVAFALLILLIIGRPSSDGSVLLLLAILLITSFLAGVVAGITAISYRIRKGVLSPLTTIAIIIATTTSLYIIVSITFWVLSFNICGIECSADAQQHWIVKTSEALTGWIR